MATKREMKEKDTSLRFMSNSISYIFPAQASKKRSFPYSHSHPSSAPDCFSLAQLLHTIFKFLFRKDGYPVLQNGMRRIRFFSRNGGNPFAGAMAGGCHRFQPSGDFFAGVEVFSVPIVLVAEGGGHGNLLPTNMRMRICRLINFDNKRNAYYFLLPTVIKCFLIQKRSLKLYNRRRNNNLLLLLLLPFSL
eukprot:gene7049-4992_t